MYPIVSLNIKNHIPHIVYQPEEGVLRKMTLEEENILESMHKMAKKLNLVEGNREINDELFAELINLARESDELYVTDLPDIDALDTEFHLNENVHSFLDRVIEERAEPYTDLQIPEEVRKQVLKDQNADTFASLMEVLYSVLIAKTVLAAADLGIGTIKLDDEHKNPRLMEKMAKELEALDIEFIVPEETE